MQIKKQQFEIYMEQLTGSKLRKGYSKAAYGHSAYLESMQSASCGVPGWVNHKLESRLLEEITTTSYMQRTTLIAVSEEEIKNLLMTVKAESKNLT